MRRTSVPEPLRSARQFREGPVYRRTKCTTCGADHRVAIRYQGGILCLECYRGATRAERQRRRRLKALLRMAIAAAPNAVVATRIARLCAYLIFGGAGDVGTSSRFPPTPRGA